MRGRRVTRSAVILLVLVGLSGCSMPKAAEHLSSLGRSQVEVVQVAHVPQQRAGAEARVHIEHVGRPPAASTRWTVNGVDPSSSTISMSWIDGPGPECGEVNRVEVAERNRSVVIGLTDTARDPKLICSAVGVERRFELHLQHRLGTRALLEPVTGADDGLANVDIDSGRLPAPTCSTNATPADAPIGMLDATEHVAPVEATGAVVCRTAWPNGRARTTETRITGLKAVRHLAAVLNTAGDPRPFSAAEPACDTRSPGAWYAVYLTGPHLRVQVFVDEINCATVTNGALRATTGPAIGKALAALFPS